MTATNNAWAEDTGLHPVVPADQRKSHRPQKKQKTERPASASTVLAMMRTRPWTSTYMALGLPLIVGFVLMAAGLITLAVTDFGAQNLVNFYRFNSVHAAVVPFIFGAVMFVNIRRNAQLMMGMGVSRWSFFKGSLLTAAYISALATLVYLVFAMVENLSFGYGVGWHVVGTGIKETSMVFPDQYSLLSTFIDYFEFSQKKFLFLFAAQGFGVLLGIVALRFSPLTSMFAFLLLPAYLLVVQGKTFINIRKDLGLWYLLQPYWVDENGGRHFYASGYDYLIGGYYMADGTEVSAPVESSFHIVLYHLQVYGLPALVVCLLAALVWRRTSLR